MASSQTLLFVIVGRNEPLFEAEFQKRGATAPSDAMTRQNYFVLHSALDLVEKAAWTSSNMYLKVVDKVCVCLSVCMGHVPYHWSPLISHLTTLMMMMLAGESTTGILFLDCREHQTHAITRG